MNHPDVLTSSTTNISLAGVLPSVDGQGHLPHIDVTFTGHMSTQQIQDLTFALNQADGLFSRFLHLAYHISATHHPHLLTTLSRNIPVNAQSYDIFYTKPQERVTVHVLAECSSRQKKRQRTGVSMPVDHDVQQLEADIGRGILDAVGELDIQTPLSDEYLRDNERDILSAIRAFIVPLQPSLKKVSLAMSSPICISSILVALRRAVNLKVLQLTPGWQYPVEEIESAILHGLSRFQRMPDLLLPGSFFSWDLFLGLGNLHVRSLCFESEIPRAFLPASVHTPRADALQLSFSSSQTAVNRIRRFKHLQSLTLTTSLDLFVDMHAILAPIKSMTHLTLTTPMLDAPMASTQMYRRIAALFPLLTSFRWKVEHAHDLETPAWLDVPGLLAFKHLDHLSITHPLPLALEDGTVARLLHAWPLMTRLSLNPCPRAHAWPPANVNGDQSVASLTWDVLRGPVRRNGVLKALGVYLGAQEYTCAPVRREFGEAMDNNHVLQQLVVGTAGPMDPDSRAVLTGMFKGANVENVSLTM
ncbi:hypothetical protein D9619_000474 [Psilocybe cf. subviscida]|uniref:Uncharacterized protein n=1 Tax=Psilocybe cf. subviscida TaxID=2480587 RepID=A0A8H5BFG1_9AGAR|nr:hypothetical protein D9619_000474 [Psilocybe cf. subviscida]